MIEKLKHFVIPRLSGWIRVFNGASASSSYIEQSYLGTGQYGNALVQSIIDIRSAFISGEGMIVSEKSPGQNTQELEYINKVLDYNQSDELLNQLAVSTEIDGKLLSVIETVKGEDNLVNIKVLPYSLYSYKITKNQDDPQIIDKIEYTSNTKNVELKTGEFVFRNFGSSLWYRPEIGLPRIASVIEYIQNIDRILLDLREINHLFASPTPFFQCESQQECEALYQQIKDQNWNIGKTLITTADYSLVCVSGDSSATLEKELILNMEKISGTTGVPIYFLGMSRLLNNRATALAMLEQLENSIIKERKIMESWFNELFYLILTYSNENFKTKYNANSIICTIQKPSVLESDQKILERLMSLYEKRIISLQTVLAYVPEVEDTDEEIKRIESKYGVQPITNES